MTNANEAQKLAYAVSCLREGAVIWWRNVLQSMPETQRTQMTYNEFQQLLRNQYQPVAATDTARAALHRIRQHNDVQTYNTAYLRYANMLTDMSTADLLYLYKQGLKTEIVREVNMHRPDTLTECMNVAQRIEIEQRLLRTNTRTSYANATRTNSYLPTTSVKSYPSYHVPTTVPMEVAAVYAEQGHDIEPSPTEVNTMNRPSHFVRTPLTAEQRQECMNKGLCFYCRQRGHLTRQCPSKNSQRQ
jgi:hypothetical protein